MEEFYDQQNSVLKLIENIESELWSSRTSNVDTLLNNFDQMNSLNVKIPLSYLVDTTKVLSKRSDVIRLELLLKNSQNYLLIDDSTSKSMTSTPVSPLDQLRSQAIFSMANIGKFADALTLWVRLSASGYITTRSTVEQLIKSLSSFDSSRRGKVSLEFVDQLHDVAKSNSWNQDLNHYSSLLRYLTQEILQCKSEPDLRQLMVRVGSLVRELNALLENGPQLSPTLPLTSNQSFLELKALITNTWLSCLLSLQHFRLRSRPPSSRDSFLLPLPASVDPPTSLPSSDSLSLKLADVRRHIALSLQDTLSAYSALSLHPTPSHPTSTTPSSLIPAMPPPLHDHRVQKEVTESLEEHAKASLRVLTGSTPLPFQSELNEVQLSLLSTISQSSSPQLHTYSNFNPQSQNTLRNVVSESLVDLAAAGETEHALLLLRQFLPSLSPHSPIHTSRSSSMTNVLFSRNQKDYDERLGLSFLRGLLASRSQDCLFVLTLARSLLRGAFSLESLSLTPLQDSSESTRVKVQELVSARVSRVNEFGSSLSIVMKELGLEHHPVFLGARIEALLPKTFSGAKQLIRRVPSNSLDFTTNLELAHSLLHSFPKNMQNHPIVFHSLLSFMCCHESPEAVLHAFNLVQRRFEQKEDILPRTYETLLTASTSCLTAPDHFIVANELQRMTPSSPAFSQSPSLLRALFVSTCRQNKAAQALRLFKALRNTNEVLGPEAYTSAMLCIYHSTPVENEADWPLVSIPDQMASYFLREMSRDGISISSHPSLLGQLIKLFTKTGMIARYQGGMGQLNSKLESFIESLCIRGGFHGHDKVPLTPNLFHHWIDFYCRSRQEDKALALLASMEERFRVTPTARCYEPIIHYYSCLEGPLEAGEDLLHLAAHRGVFLTPPMADYLLFGSCRSHGPSAALDLAQEIFHRHRLRPSFGVMSHLLRHILDHKDAPSAKQFLDVIKLIYPRGKRKTSHTNTSNIFSPSLLHSVSPLDGRSMHDKYHQVLTDTNLNRLGSSLSEFIPLEYYRLTLGPRERGFLLEENLIENYKNVGIEFD